MINIDSLYFSYGTSSFELTIPELSVIKKEKLAIIGPSGSGKTSLLKLISGILLPQTGLITIGSHAVNKVPDHTRRDFRIANIGFIFQDFELLDYLDVLDNIVHPFRITKALKINAEVRSRAIKLAEELGIQDKLKSLPGTLSQGEKQRTAICRALLSNPSLILADEATGNLDPNNKSKILDALFECSNQYDATLVAVTHDHELLNRFDRVIDFNDYCQPNSK